jgi:hypothetical protein
MLLKEPMRGWMVSGQYLTDLTLLFPVGKASITLLLWLYFSKKIKQRKKSR